MGSPYQPDATEVNDLTNEGALSGILRCKAARGARPKLAEEVGCAWPADAMADFRRTRSHNAFAPCADQSRQQAADVRHFLHLASFDCEHARLFK
jgi:hypothetical protein